MFLIIKQKSLDFNFDFEMFFMIGDRAVYNSVQAILPLSSGHQSSNSGLTYDPAATHFDNAAQGSAVRFERDSITRVCP